MRSMTEGEEGMTPMATHPLKSAAVLPLRRLRRHLPLAGEDYLTRQSPGRTLTLAKRP